MALPVKVRKVNESPPLWLPDGFDIVTAMNENGVAQVVTSTNPGNATKLVWARVNAQGM